MKETDPPEEKVVAFAACEVEQSLLMQSHKDREIRLIAELRTNGAVHGEDFDRKGYFRRGWWLDGSFLGATMEKAARKMRKWYPE